MPIAQHWRSEFTANATTTAGAQPKSAAAGLLNDTSVVVWTDNNAGNGDIVGQRFDPFGNPVGGLITIAATSDQESDPEVTALEGGGFVVTWTRQTGAGSKSVEFRKFSESGQPLTNVASVPGRAEMSSAAGLANGSWVITYTDPIFNHIYSDVYSADGAILWDIPALISPPVPVGHSSVARLANGNFVYAYVGETGASTSPDLYFEIINPTTGNHVSVSGFDFTKVNSPGPDHNSSESEPSVTALSNGGFAIAFTHQHDGSDTVAYVHVYDAAGNAVGSPIGLSEHLSDQGDIARAPRVTALKGESSGYFVVTYTSNRAPGGSGLDIVSDLFYNSGVRVGPSVVNAVIAGDQDYSAIAALSDGRFIASWTAFQAIGGTDIHAQIMDSRSTNIGGTSGADFIVGHDTGQTDVDDIITGYEGDDTIYSLAGADFLYGGSGNDYLDGGIGNDVLTGNSGADTINGGADFDIVTYDGSSVSVTVGLGLGVGTGGDAEGDVYIDIEGAQGSQTGDKLVGNASVNTLIGLGGDDTINGGAGNDTMIGGIGDDLYFVDSSFDSIVENANEGTETVYASASFALTANVENLILQGTAQQGIGNSGANQIIGNASDNLIDGGAGIDGLIGGAGSDTYIIDNSFDQIVENANEGQDIVYSSVSYALGANLETLFLQGSAVQGIGNSVANLIVGTDGSNLLDGGAGIDGLIGGKGDDTYIIDNYQDQIVENANEGTDTVYAAVDYQLGANLEQLFMQGSAVQGFGNALVNSIVGTTGANAFDGGAGGDVITGNGGNDVYIERLHDANGDTIMDFNAGDSIQFFGYGAGGHVTQVNSTVWQVSGANGSDLFTLANGAALPNGSIVFLVGSRDGVATLEGS